MRFLKRNFPPLGSPLSPVPSPSSLQGLECLTSDLVRMALSQLKKLLARLYADSLGQASIDDRVRADGKRSHVLDLGRHGGEAKSLLRQFAEIRHMLDDGNTGA